MTFWSFRYVDKNGNSIRTRVISTKEAFSFSPKKIFFLWSLNSPSFPYNAFLHFLRDYSTRYCLFDLSRAKFFLEHEKYFSKYWFKNPTIYSSLKSTYKTRAETNNFRPPRKLHFTIWSTPPPPISLHFLSFIFAYTTTSSRDFDTPHFGAPFDYD